MKKILLLISSAFLLVNLMNAQHPTWPTHPMDTQFGDKPEHLIEKCSYRDSIGNLEGGYILHKYSLDGYIDTIYTNMQTTVNFYSKETNKLIQSDTYGSIIQHPISARSLYEYDKQGRLLSEKFTFYIYDLENKLTGTEDSTYLYDLSTIVTTDSGYIYKDVEYIFDNQDRLIRMKTNHMICDYTYFDKGYAYLKYEVNPEEGSGQQERLERYFDEKGLLTNSRTFQKSYDQTEWAFIYNEFFEYTFYTDDTANSLIERKHTIYGETGIIKVNTTQPEWIRIYSIGGQLINQSYVTDQADIMVSKGIYIVTAGSESYKVIVK